MAAAYETLGQKYRDYAHLVILQGSTHVPQVHSKLEGLTGLCRGGVRPYSLSDTPIFKVPHVDCYLALPLRSRGSSNECRIGTDYKGEGF
jgi:hypothetical protein